MERTIGLALNAFATIPHSLRTQLGINSPKGEIIVNLASLYHHYYLDTYGITPPDPDPANFEYLKFLTSSADFRIRGGGIGISTGARRNRSTELGQAFCRWFLHDHLNITYFAHVANTIRDGVDSRFGQLRLERIELGDIPDYLCAENSNDVYLAEAKGRYDSISFRNIEFAAWRKQFNRVALKDSTGEALSIKGFIVGTRFATEEDSSSLKSRIHAEDPRSPGDLSLENSNVHFQVGASVISKHYGNIAMKLNQPQLSAALLGGFQMDDQLRVNAVVWQFQLDPLKGKRFVGGYFPKGEFSLYAQDEHGHIYVRPPNSLDLTNPRATFFGVEESIFRKVMQLAREGSQGGSDIPQFESLQPFYSAISVLRDGSMLAPAEFLLPVGAQTY